MNRALLKYYYDLTRYNLGFSILVEFVSPYPFAGVITFGTFGMLIGVMSFRYFQNNQYYFYLNLGLSKTKLIATVWSTNIFIAAIILFVISK